MARLHARGAECGACGLHLHTRTRVITHLHRHPRTCLALLRATVEPMGHDEALRTDEAEAVAHRKWRAKGVSRGLALQPAFFPPGAAGREAVVEAVAAQRPARLKWGDRLREL